MTKSGKETNLWAEVTPEMMSDEELEGNVYVRHQPSYRSDGLNAFIKKLDLRLETDDSNRVGRGAHPRLERRLGSPREKPAPVLAKKWAIRKDHRPQRNHVNNPVLSNTDTEQQGSNSQANNPVLTNINSERHDPNAETQDSNSLVNEDIDAMEDQALINTPDVNCSDGDSSPLLEISDSDSDMY